MGLRNNNCCPLCGGEIKKIKFGEYKCLYCDNTIQRSNNDLSLYEKAYKQLETKRFKEAVDKFEILIGDYNFDPELNWALFLAKHGIEFLNDGTKISATIHRPLFNHSFEDDQNAKNAIEYSEGEEQQKYKKLLNELEKLRLQIIERKQTINDIDVFICCKIHEDKDKIIKTEAANLAGELYKELKITGLNIFYPGYDLPASVGDYESVIYAALQSAKYMVIIGDTQEHLNSPWVKNQWERFIRLPEYSQVKTNSKLIIKNGLQTQVPDILKNDEYIVYDSKDNWIKKIREAITSNIKPKSGINHHISIFDYSMLLKPIQKKLIAKKPEVISSKAHSIKTQAVSTPEYYFLNEDEFNSQSIETCEAIIKSHLSSKHYNDANIELIRYLNETGTCIEDSEYSLIKLKVIIETKSQNVEDFIKNHISQIKNTSLLKQFFAKMSASDFETFLPDIKNYILNSIIDGVENNAIDCFEVISRIKNSKVTELNFDVLNRLAYLAMRPHILKRFINALSPYCKADDIDKYFNMTTEIVKKLCAKECWDCATILLDKLTEIDEEHNQIQLLRLMLNNKAKSFEELLTSIENDEKYYVVQELLPKMHKNGAEYLLEILEKHIEDLIDHNKTAKAARWTEIALIVDGNMDEFIDRMLEKCALLPSSDEVFSILIGTLTEDEREKYIKYVTIFINQALSNENYSISKKYCKLLNEIEPYKIEILKNYLKSEIKSNNLENIHELKDFTIIEKWLAIKETDDDRTDLIKALLEYCNRNLDNKKEKIEKDDPIFTVFDDLLRYCVIKNDALRNIKQFANHCLRLRMYKKAEYYYNTVISINNDDCEAYWGKLLAVNECSKENELIAKGISINNSFEFKKAIEKSATMGMQENFDKYNRVSKLIEKNKRKNKNKLYFLCGVISVIITIIVLALII